MVANECVKCVAGEWRVGGDPVPGPDTTCSTSLCEANERVLNHTCVACPEGSVNAAGDDASRGDTSCACTENHHVSETGLCKECLTGTVRPAGDQIADGSTSCEPVCFFLKPDNGSRGTCDDTLVAGSSCSPECYVGFVSSGDTTCDEDGRMTATTCVPSDIEEAAVQDSEAGTEVEEVEAEAEGEEAGAVPLPPEPPPGPVILVNDEYAGARQGDWCTISAVVVSLVVALWA